ncbi:phosphotransferase, partial [Candidatus Woesearchaeota archaeon]|nr:phosphotransferase [Candidatus Woesearchaeota archaeon]
MNKKNNKCLEAVLTRKEQEPEVISLVKELGWNEEAHQQLLSEIKGLDDRDERKRKFILGKQALEKKDYSSALFSFIDAGVEDDKLYAAIGDKFVMLAEDIFRNDPFTYSGAYLNATVAFGKIKDNKLLKEKNRQAAERVLEFAKKLNPHYTTILTHAATFYHYSGEDKKISDLGDMVVSWSINEKDSVMYPEVDFNNGILIYGMINNLELFGQKIRETLDQLITLKEVDFHWIEKCLDASRLGKNDELKFDDSTIERVTDLWRKSKSVSPMSSFEHYKLKTMNTNNIEKMADELFEREIENDEVEYDRHREEGKPKRDLFRVQQLYNKMKRRLPNDKLRRLGEKAEGKKEFSFAMWAYKRLNSTKDMDRIIQKAIDDDQFDALPGILQTRIMQNNSYHPYHPVLQKGMLDGFKKALEKEDAYHMINLAIFHLMPELIRDDFCVVGDYLLEKADGLTDFENIQFIYQKTEKALTSEKLGRIAQKLIEKGENDLSQKVLRTRDYVQSLGKDNFSLVKNKYMSVSNKLFWEIREYLLNAEKLRESDDENRKKEISTWLKSTINRISKLATIKDISKVESVLDEFRHYKGSERLLKMAEKAKRHKEYNHMSWALRNADDKNALLKAGKYLLKIKKYDWAASILNQVSNEKSVELVSNALKSDLLYSIKNDMNSGLELLLTTINDKQLKKYFKLDLTSEEEANGHISKVSSIKFQSKKLLGEFNISVKVDQYSPQDSQLLDKEALIYKALEKNSILTPRILKIGKVNQYYVGVFEYLPGSLLTQSEIDHATLRKIVKTTKKMQQTLKENLTKDEKLLFMEKDFENDDFYVRKIITRFQEKMGVSLSEEALTPLNSYLKDDKLLNERVIITDRNPTNIIYNQKKGQLQMIDFNAARVSLPQEDWAFFIDDPRLKTNITRE